MATTTVRVQDVTDIAAVASVDGQGLMRITLVVVDTADQESAVVVELGYEGAAELLREILDAITEGADLVAKTT
jgi:predicted neutral ceramidase superfamily lipid hydrolase